MDSQRWYQWAADGLLIVHAGFIAFVVLGFVAILVGLMRRWSWSRNPWFRLTHVLAIAVVVAQAWLGRACPLTVWEAELRRRAGQPAYDGSFVQYWLHRVIFYEAEPWVFVLVYTGFGLAVLLVYLLAPPRPVRFRRG